MELIADIGHNWYDAANHDSPEKGLALIKAAQESGADGICFPLFKAEEVYREKKDQKQTKHFEIPDNWVNMFVAHARNLSLSVFLSPSYEGSVELAEAGMDIDGYHIDNGNLRHDRLVEAVANTKKEVLISSGLYAYEEMVMPLGLFSPGDVTLLQSYGMMPTSASNSRLPSILSMAAFFWDRLQITRYGLNSVLSTVMLDIMAMSYNLHVLMRKIDIPDYSEIPSAEAGWSLSPEEFRKLSEASTAVQMAVNPKYEYENLTAMDIMARNRLLRDPDDFKIPCNCGVDDWNFQE